MNEALSTLLSHADPKIQQVLFVDGAQHPLWPDNADVIALACQQILDRVLPIPEEKLFAFVGAHAKSRFTNSRDSLGWIITDKRVVSQDHYSVIGEANAPKVYAFSPESNPELLTDALRREFDLTVLSDMGGDVVLALRSVLDIVVPEAVATGNLQVQTQATTLKERAEELGLGTALKWPNDDEKHVKKLAKSLNATDIRCAMSDSVLFGKVYGVALCAEGIVSKDLMEDPVHSTWAEIAAKPVTPDETKDGLLGGGTRHVVPSSQAQHREKLARLINEIAGGTVS